MGGGGLVSVQGGFLSGGLCPGGVSVQRGPCPEGSLSRGVSVWGVSVHGGSLSRGVSVRETPRTVKSGRYASYWNAYLLFIALAIVYTHFTINLIF